jgi:hypothetical protein
MFPFAEDKKPLRAGKAPMKKTAPAAKDKPMPKGKSPAKKAPARGSRGC